MGESVWPIASRATVRGDESEARESERERSPSEGRPRLVDANLLIVEEMRARFEAKVRAALLRKLPPELANIVESVVWEAVAKSIATSDRKNDRAWLMGIVRHKIADALRDRRRENDRLDEYATLTDQREEARHADEVDHRSDPNLRRIIASAYAQVPPEFVRAQVLWYRGHSYVEIAEMEGIPEGTAKSRVSTANQTLRRLLHSVRPNR